MGTEPRIEFDAAEHRYWLVWDGRRVEAPSTTGILRRVGLINLSHVNPERLARARDRGRRVHQAAQYLTEGTLDWSSVAVGDRGYVDAYARFLTDSKARILRQEVRLADPLQVVCGTTDALGWWDGAPAIFDLKTGDPELVAARYQLASYERMLRILASQAPKEWIEFDPRSTPIARVSVGVRADGTYKPQVYDKAARDASRWQAAVTIYRTLEERAA